MLVSVRMLSGEVLDCFLPGPSTVRDLKLALRQRAGIKPSRLQLVTPEGRLCEEEDGLLEIWGSILAGMLDPKVLKRVLLELTLHAIVCSDVCFVCEARFARRCGRCLIVRYCSESCQMQDWSRHRKECCVRKERGHTSVRA